MVKACACGKERSCCMQRLHNTLWLYKGKHFLAAYNTGSVRDKWTSGHYTVLKGVPVWNTVAGLLQNIMKVQNCRGAGIQMVSH